ncbi:MAG: beta-ketoacyl-ACP synthase II [Chloroflexi bacterium]|nr:beta-ketoacyl-ACP synthase II [Anaerolineae bacterium]MCC6566899.1 beta-ketoacyl-ACP synthase II [Chloroflexota bacterium]OQY82275.1 MAG: beta-ketoacyl-[acyl-carrier-protein] synthase II [Anaerolineae bacterium UTCFX5]MCO6444529.1 beta-ketoacyl-ACP synthase II [Anaerolineae bacterium]MEB2365511.1 beta-ketoacyl-ACP synthase II [Chloroflexota bacterium]
MSRRRVVVTGLGIICPIGNTVEEAWKNAANGVSGIAPIQSFDPKNLENRFAGEVKGFDAEAFLGKREARRTDRVTQLALYSAYHAMQDSKLEISDDNRYEVASIVGTGIGGIHTIYESVLKFLEGGAKQVSPLLVPMMLPDAVSSRVSMQYGTRGPNFSLATACATGNNCIGEATEIIRRGQAVAALAGSSESALVELTIASFNNMTAISRRNDEPQRASRPFDKGRDGFVVSEGAAVLILEELEYAKARGAHIYAEILGYGHTSDAYHVTAPMETGEGAAMAMTRAMQDAGVTAQDIDYINAHGTSTPLNDKAETTAVKRALGEQAYNIPISSTKSVTGHLMGSAGSVEAVLTIMAMQNNFVPPTINLDDPDPECDLNYTPHKGIHHNIDVAMSNSFGFGGHNAVLIFGKYSENGRN